MFKTRLLSTTAALSIMASAGTATVYAQDADTDEEVTLEEIVVTARKKEENLQDVPLAITAFTADTIEKAGIQDVQDLALQTPGFSHREGFGRATGGANNRPSIRGMSNILGSPNAAFFVDGVYVSGPITSYDLGRVDRVEVIRGPQSAMFGRGTFSGAVNFISARPSNEWRGNIGAQFGQHGRIEVDGFISGPLVEDKVAFELSASHYQFGGDYVNQVNGEKELGDEKTNRFGAKLSLTPNEGLSVYIDMAYSEDRDKGFAYGLWNGGDPDVSTASANQVNCFEPDLRFVIFANVGSTRSRGYYCGEIGSHETAYYDLGGRNGVVRDTFRSTVVIDYDIGDYTLTSLTGYTTFDYQNAFGATYPNGFASWSVGSQKYFSEELRLQSPQDQALRWLAGVYYFKNSSGDDWGTSWNPLTTDTPTEADIALETNNSYLKNVAAFGSMELDLAENLVMSAEARYQEETRHLEGTGIDNPLTAEVDDAPADLKFTAFLPRLSLKYDLSDNVNIYASAAKGNKPGGYNSDFFASAFDVDERAAFLQDGKGTYEESKVWSYELGTKGTIMDGRVQYNASVYYLDWTAQPLTTSDALRRQGSSSQSTVAPIVNAGSSEIKGFEVDFLARISKNFDLRVAYAHSDAAFKDYEDENFRDLQDTNGYFSGPAVTSKAPDSDNDGVVDGAPGVLIVGTLDDGRVLLEDTVDHSGQVAGNALPQTPKHMATISPTLRWQMGETEAYLRADYSYESKRYVQAANLAWMGATHKLNLRLGFETENWSLSVYAENLTKEDTPEVVTRLADFRDFFFIPSQVRTSFFGRGTFTRDFAVTPPRKREFGVKMSYRF